MNSQGYTKDNIHKGNTKIVAGGIDVDGLIRVGDQSVGGDGYVLPAVKGTEGQVLTMNADNTTTSFKDIPSSTERICINRWFSINQNGKAGTGQGTFLYNVTDSPTDSPYGRITIGNNVIPASDLDLTNPSFSTMYLQIRNDVNNADPLQDNINTFILVLTTGGITSQIEFEPMNYTGLTTGGATFQTSVEHYIHFARLTTQPDKIYISCKGVKATNQLSTTLPATTNTDKPFHSHNQFKLGSGTGNLNDLNFPNDFYQTGCYLSNYVDGDDIIVDIQATRGTGTPNTVVTHLVMGRLDTFKNKILAGGAGGGGGVSDHLLLTNLNGGALLDGGHTNMFLTNGNKPMTGNIDMNTNNITNVSTISNTAPMVLFETANANAIILNRDVNNGIYLECIDPAQNINLSAGGGSNSFQVRPTDILAGSNLDMNNNDVINVSDLRGIGSNNHINMNPSNQMDISSGVIAINSSSALLSNANNYQVFRILNQDKILVTGSRIYIKNAPLDMDNNNIDNAAIISGPNGDLDFTGTETHLNSNNDLHLEAASNFNTEVRIQGSGEFKVLHGGGDRFSVENNIIRANRDFSMLNNDIGDVRSISMNNTLAEHPIIIYLPALVADFPNPIKNLLVKINSSGNIQPIAYGDPDSTGVIGTTDEIVVANGLVRVQVGGICSFTPSSGQTINAGQEFERANTGSPVLFGTVIVATGVGTCGVALTSGTGASDGSVKILGLWTKNEHF
jgi:hypothetical protein